MVQPINLWPAVRWGAMIREAGEERWCELPHPFALIGSDPRCDIVIAENRLPPVVYLAVLRGERIELWPLCAIAFPVWGPIKGKPQVMVGKSKLRFIREGEPQWPAPGQNRPGDAINEVEALRLEVPGPNASLAMDWGGGTQLKPINRPVSILGEGHPSLIRLHGVGLRTCELGVVCVGAKIWVIQLNPSVLRPDEAVVRQLSQGGESTLIGDLHLWANESGEKTLRTFGQPLMRSPFPVAASRSAEAALAARPPYSSAAVPRPAGPFSTVPAEAPRAADGSLAAAGTVRSGQELYVQLGQAVPQTLDADQFATTFTDRLLEKTGRRAFRENLLKWSISLLLMFCALFAIGYILIRGILPIVDAIFTE